MSWSVSSTVFHIGVTGVGYGLSVYSATVSKYSMFVSMHLDFHIVSKPEKLISL